MVYKYIFIFLFVLLSGCTEATVCKPEFEKALVKFFEVSDKKDIKSIVKARHELEALSEKCDFPSGGLEIPMMGVFMNHHLMILTSKVELLRNMIRNGNVLDDRGLPG